MRGHVIVFAVISICYGSAAAADGIEPKLEAQFARYQDASERFKAHYDAAPTPITRPTWEEWLRSEDPLSAADLAQLVASQRLRIKVARESAARSSRFSLDKLRGLPAEQKAMEAAAFCAAMPKGGLLHVHLSGTVKPATAEVILRRLNPVLPLSSLIARGGEPNSDQLLYPAELQTLRSLGPDQPYLQLSPAGQQIFLSFFELPAGPQPFERFDATFGFLSTVYQDSATIIDAFAARCAAEGVSYAELRLGFRADDLPGLARAVANAEQRTGVKLRLIEAFYRGQSVEDQQSELSELSKIRQAPDARWVVGTDLLGNERATPMFESSQALYASLQKVTLGRTVHAGEIGDLRDPRDAMILAGDSARLGHAVLLARDPVVLEYAARKHVAVEVNLTSNLRLAGVGSVEEHPFLDYLRLGLPVSLSTDDEGVFATDIDRECEDAVLHSDVTYAEMKQMAFHSLERAFAAEADKTELLENLARSFAGFEKAEERLGGWTRAERLPPPGP